MNLQPQPFAIWLAQRANRQLTRIIDRIECLLAAFRVEVLAKISLAIEQAHSGHRHAQVAGRLHLVARYVAQPTGINGQRLAQHELHAEVGNRGERRLPVLVLEPRLRTVGFPVLAKQMVEARAKLRRAQSSFDLLFGDRPQDDPWILGCGPKLLVEFFPQFIGCVVPGPVQVERQLHQGVDSIDLQPIGRCLRIVQFLPHKPELRKGRQLSQIPS